MPVRRTATAVAIIATLLLALAAPAGAATETTTRGTAATTSVPLQVTVDDLTTKLGEVALIATTDSDTEDRAPWSSVGLTLADVAGTTVGDLAVSSDGTTTNPGQSFGQDTALGSVGATVANLLAIADDTAGSATAALTSLSTNATVLENVEAVDGLGLTATITDVVASVDDTGAAATHSLAVGEINLGLDHVLGDVLATLPLADLLALADELGIVVPNLDAADDVVTATEGLVTAVEGAVTASNAVPSAAEDLLTADGGTLEALQTLLGELDTISDGTLDAGAVSALITLLTDPLLSDCSVTPTLGTLSTDLQAVEACLTNAIDAHLTALGGLASTLQDALVDYLDAVVAAADAALVLENISDSIDDLIADLLDVDLLALDDINVTQQVRAIGGQEDASSASTTCQLTTLSVLDGDPIDLSNCDATGAPVTSAVDLVSTTLQSVLDTVGGVDVEGDLVQLDLFGTAQDAVTSDGDTVYASSVLEVLSLTIPDITIDVCDVEVAGDLACALGLEEGLDLDGAITQVDGVLTTAQATVTDALDLIDDDLASELGLDLDTSAADGVQTIVTSALDTLMGVLEGLGDGQGVEVPGIKIVVDPELAAEHQVTTASVDDPTPADPTPADPAPDSPGDDPTLPNTGGGAALLAVLAIGAGAWLWRGRRREG